MSRDELSGGRRRGSNAGSERGLRERFRSLFSPGTSGEPEPRSSSRQGSVASLHLARDKLALLAPDTELSLRLKQMQALQPLLVSKRLDPTSLDALWRQVRDLCPRLSRSAQGHLSAEARRQVLTFLQTLAKHQLGTGPSSEVLRAAVFACLKDTTPLEFGDADGLALELLVALSEGGRVGLGLGMGPLVVRWSDAIVETVPRCDVSVVRWLDFLGELVKNSAGALEAEEAERLVTLLCVHASASLRQQESLEEADVLDQIKGCLRVLDRILCWAVFPRALVQMLVKTLSKLVNQAELSSLSWRVMRNVLCSYLGYTCVIQLCTLLEEGWEAGEGEAVVLRGAIFFLAMGLWGSQRVDNLFYSPVAVLNAFRSALRSDSLIITYETLVSLKRLVDKYGKELQYLTWSTVLEILEDVRRGLADCESDRAGDRNLDYEQKVREMFHLVLDSMEALEDASLYLGNQSQLYSLIESCSADRPEASILTLLSFRSSAINPQCSSWIQDYHQLLYNYYFSDGRPTVRIKVLNIVRTVYEENRHLHDVALLQEVVFPICSDLPHERDVDVSHTGLALLADIGMITRARVRVPSDDSVHSYRDAFLEIVDIFHKFLSHSLGSQARRKHHSGDEELSADHTLRLMDSVEKALELLIKLLRVKWRLTPAYHSLYLLKLLARVLALEYNVGMNDELGSGGRELIVALLSRLKANPASTRIGLVFEPDQVVEGKSWGMEESPYLVCHDAALGPLQYQEESLEREVALDWSWIADVLITVVRKERVWRVLSQFLGQLPELLKNRALILSHPESVPRLTAALTEVSLDEEKTQSLIPASEAAEVNLADKICPSLAILVAYREILSRELQEKLVSGIQTALVSGTSIRAVLGWVMCIVELPSVVLGMSRELVKHLDGLRKTPTMIIPVFELSSTLLRLPNLYAQFREEDFLHVFDALLPATDTFAFTTFIVAVGHHLVYRWFLKVPLQLRPRMASHIRRRLEEIRVQADSKGQGGDPQLGLDENFLMDEFLRHYTFTNAPADADPPLPSQLIELIRREGWTRHWVERNRVISISAVSQAGSTGGGCRKCSRAGGGGAAGAPREEADEFGSQRKRHQSAVQGRVTRAPQPAQPLSQDDSQLPPAQPRSALPSSLCSCWSKGYALIEIRHCFGKSFWLVEINGAHVSRLQDINVLVKLNRMVVERESRSKEARERAASDKGGCPLSEPLSIRIEEGELGPGDESEKSGDSSISGSYASAKSTPGPATLDASGDAEASEWDKASRGVKFAPSTPTSASVAGETPVGLNPGWIFAQLFPSTAEDRVELGGDGAGVNGALRGSERQRPAVERSLRNLDLLPPYEAHKIGVVYAGPKQTSEGAMLGNESGTERYTRFLDGLGKLLPLKEKPAHIWTAGLDPNGNDGPFTYHWTDPITQVLFHVATLMPSRPDDPACRNKKRHIGNDFVVIVYNDSGREYALETLTGQFSFVAIVVTPLHAETLSLKLLSKDAISRWLSLKEAVVSDKEAPLLCRQIGMRAEFSAHCWQSGQAKAHPAASIRSTYISGAMERLHAIQALRQRYAAKEEPKRPALPSPNTAPSRVSRL